MNLTNFSDPNIAESIVDKIAGLAESLGAVKIMEVCGTHTMEIGRLGLRSLLPKNIELISGPGCPVCVTPGAYIDAAAHIALGNHARIVTFGDMVRVPGLSTSLDEARSKGAIIDVVTSPLHALEIAKNNASQEVVFLTVGFETTSPASAKTIQRAKQEGLTNLSFFVSHKIVPPALSILINDKDLKISGFMLPGHVSAIIGEKPYQPIAKQGIPAVITGFEPLDILTSVFLLCDMLYSKKAAIINAYSRIVQPGGNPIAIKTVDNVFEITDTMWRGIGILPMSGLKIRGAYKDFDASVKYNIQPETMASPMPDSCSCGDVLKGRIRPNQCPLFSTTCTPSNPIGPCMVSSEGSCAAYFRYGA